MLAERSDEMGTYEAGLGEHGSRDQYRRIAKYYEQRNLLADAARHYANCEEYPTALKLYLKVGEKEIDHAIEVVGRARNDALTHTLIDYLMGETDNVPKDANYVYRLHKALGNYMQAAGTAHIIAKQEQEMGNYKQARRWKPCLKNVKSHLVSGHIDLGLCWLKTCRSCGVSRSLFSGMEQ